MSGIKDALNSAVGTIAVSADNTERSGSALLDRLGDKVFGRTAESENNEATPIAPDATVTPVTQGRRTVRPDGQDPFRNDAPAPADES